MKIKILLSFFAVISLINVNSQTTTPNNIGTAAKFLGYSNNFSLQTRTDNIVRSKYNGTINYGVGGYAPTQKNGYMLLGFSGTFAAPFFGVNTPGAYSLMHLNGPNGGFVQNGGYRPWMQTGITFTDNQDLSYMGIRSVS
ncbi:MAG: hypothetical protein JNJ99_05045, partial [Crocinitomicaceae bacterium]|nr:hypothetical protein [Crocinitomicaceae bacterium]